MFHLLLAKYQVIWSYVSTLAKIKAKVEEISHTWRHCLQDNSGVSN